MNDDKHDIALVMGGGGARAAYQVGVLRSIAQRYPKLRVPILTGVSAGAINTAFLANCTDDFQVALEKLTKLWSGLTTDQVFKSNAYSLLKIASRWGLRLVSGGRHLAPMPRGMVDTSPLREFLDKALQCKEGVLCGVGDNLRSGRLQAVAITTSDYGTGQSVTHVQSNRAPMWKRPQRLSLETTLTVDHVMASAALPLFFPAIQLGSSWHGDGGIRLTAPLSPALHLGAGRVLAISTRYEKNQIEADHPATSGYPPPAQVLGQLLNAVFLDMLEYDALNMERINQLIEALPDQKRIGLRTAGLLLLRPSRNLSTLASEYEPHLPQPFKFLMRGTGTRETKSPESLSMVMFEPAYIRHVMEIGEQDGDRHKLEIDAFLAGERLPGIQSTGFWRIG
jgi:NTE family protein